MKKLTLGKGCFSCAYRGKRSGQSIKCLKDNKYYWLNLLCGRYKPTIDNRILSYAAREIVLHGDEEVWLTNWLKRCGIMKKSSVPNADTKM